MAVKKKERNILEDSDVVIEKLESAEDFFKTNQKWVYIIIGVILVAVAGIFTFKYFKESQAQIAQNELFRPINFFESDSVGKALEGDGNTMGFPAIAEEYSLTKPGNLAEYYAGAAYLKDGKFQEAIDYLKDFSSSDILVQARAYSLIGDANMELKNFEEAAKFYGKAAEYNPNKFFSPQYLMKQALAYEKQGDNQAALNAYDQIIEEYFDASEYNDARKNKARIEALISK
ncbi:MAG TPA: tetratricopeptide repeat protein [Cytophagales bacterium]|nr:tetratricopeptide repeat protein [Cytophagales bacterium]